MTTRRPLSPSTVVVSAGRPDRTQGAPVNPPVVLSSTYVSTGTPQPDELVYARMDTETWHPFEQALAALEGAELPALVLASGMAAVAAACSLVPAGGRIVLPRHVYHGTQGCVNDLTSRSNVRQTPVDIGDTDQVIRALSDADGAHGPAAVLWIESPTNPMLEVADLPALVAAAHAVGALVIVDNTFATPLGQRPLEHDADVVLHSATKYIAGHSDVVLGAVLTSNPDLRARLQAYRTIHGAVAGPFEVYLALRGLRTLSLRFERSTANALELARRLSTDPRVAEVQHPSLPTHPGHEVAARTMDTFGSILTLRPKGGAAAAEALAEAVELWLPGTSLGGVESSLERRRRFTSEAPTVPDDLLRLSVGIEDVEDLWADLSQALDVATSL